MKKILVLMVLVVAIGLVLTSCDLSEVFGHIVIIHDSDTCEHIWGTTLFDEETGVAGHKCMICDYFEPTFILSLPDNSEDENACRHDWQLDIIDATCTEGGYVIHTCKICGAVEKDRDGSLPQHTFNPYRFSIDDEYHWNYCTLCGERVNKEAHTLDENGECTVCMLPILDTPGVIFGVHKDGTYAVVMGYDGTENKVKIAKEINGIPVKAIYSGAFLENESITSVVIPEGVTHILDSAFYGCTSLNSVVMPESLTSIYDFAFSNCSSLYSVTIPKGVTKIGDFAFFNCTGLRSVILPDGLTSIGDRAFGFCYKLVSAVLPDSLTYIGRSAFDFCEPALFLEYESGFYLGSADNPYYALIDIKNSYADSFTIHEDTKHIGSEAFEGCVNLTSITIPDSVRIIDEEAFSDCTALSSVIIGDSVTSIGEKAFYYCTALSSVIIGDSVSSIGEEAFSYCTSLSSVIIGDSVSSIGEEAFYYCTALSSVIIGDSVTSIGDLAFYRCSNLKDVYYTGSEEDWAKISMSTSTFDFKNITIHFGYLPEE